MSTDLNVWIDRVMHDVTLLSKQAKAEGDMPTYYAANRAWNALYDARSDRERRRDSLKTAQGEQK